jgi:hypothetical protein
MNQQDPTADAVNELNGVFTMMSVEEVVEQESVEGAVGAEPTTAVTGTAPAGVRGGSQVTSPLPLSPTPILIPSIRRTVSGRYRGRLGGFELELRLDVDRVRPMKKVSGDFYAISGSTVTYVGSFIVNNPVITISATQVTCRGSGQFTFNASAPVVQVTIQRRTVSQPPAPAQVQFFTQFGSPGAAYTCAFESMFFRTVQLETDCTSDITPPVFSTYNTGALPSGGPTRNLSVVSAYAEAGIEIRPTTGTNVINMDEAGGDKRWSDSELHNSMVRHFTLFRNVPQWAVWLAVAQDHEFGPGLLGIMFDQLGPQRQGCAVFHRSLGGTTPQQLREQLQTYVHELGHCFNLLHSWQKSFANPPDVNRPNSLSWMNYPWRYPLGGEAAFWAAFPFQFDDGEVIHLRHAFRNNIVMGGNPFLVGSGSINPEIMGDPIADESGLKFDISTANPSFALGEPIVLKLMLGTRDERNRIVHPYLHPNLQMTTVAIAKPNGQVVAYEPWIDHLVSPSEQGLIPGQLIEDSAYIGFGKGGLYFGQPGLYQIRAIYHALDGSLVLSNVLSLRVRYPVTAKDERLAELLIGQEQGALFYLLGSDSDSLSRGRAALDQVLEEYDKHPIANYVRLVKGVNLARNFKTIYAAPEERKESLHLRQANTAAAERLIASAAAETSPIDTITKSQSLSKLAMAQRTAGDAEGASKSLTLAASFMPERKKYAASA